MTDGRTDRQTSFYDAPPCGGQSINVTAGCVVNCKLLLLVYLFSKIKSTKCRCYLLSGCQSWNSGCVVNNSYLCQCRAAAAVCRLCRSDQLTSGVFSSVQFNKGRDLVSTGSISHPQKNS